jgi:hypothetical protein
VTNIFIDLEKSTISQPESCSLAGILIIEQEHGKSILFSTLSGYCSVTAQLCKVQCGTH